MVAWSSAVAVGADSQVVPGARPAAGTRPEPVLLNSRQLLVHYQVSRSVPVSLFVTSDGGTTWHLDRTVDGHGTSIEFDADKDGLWGFYLMPQNADEPAVGPRSGTSPQHTVAIDTTQPILQVGDVTPGDDFSRHRVLTIRLSAYDEHLADGPIDLFYRRVGQARWHAIVRRQANVNRYAWQVPADLKGPVEIRVEATDRAGNRTIRTTGPAVISAVGAQPLSNGNGEGQRRSHPQPEPLTRPAADLSPGSPDAVQLAMRRYQLAKAYRHRGEYAMAEYHLLAALKANPQMGASRLELAEVLLARGRYRQAAQQYQALKTIGGPLGLDGTHGLALTNLRQRNYLQAGKLFAELLKKRPNDASAWLYKGDALANMGRRDEAREAWNKAVQVAPNATETIELAKRRLMIYPPYRPVSPVGIPARGEQQ